MAWRGLHISKPTRLSVADGQLVAAQDDGEVRLALEDIAWIVLDTPQASVTSALLSACMEMGIALICTDATHTPSGVTLPFHRHFRQAGIAMTQVGLGEPIKKRLWQNIIRAKILNQAAILSLSGRQGYAPLMEMARHVASGDPDNIEARAARAYWGSLFVNFRRDDDRDLRNKMLNYGYAIIRSGVARALTAAGLIPALGIHHASITNSFNLADDLVEPFRPIVDIEVLKLAGDMGRVENDMTIDHRRALATVLLKDAYIGSDQMTVLAATELSAASLVQAMESGSAAVLRLPSLFQRKRNPG